MFSYVLRAQNPGDIRQVMEGEAHLARLIGELRNTSSAEERNVVHTGLLETMEDVLRMPAAFYYPFDSLEGIARIREADGRFRIFTWEFGRADGSIGYYGFVTTPTCDKYCEVIPLNDMEGSGQVTEYSVHGAGNWPGAVYYDVKTVKSGKVTYYILLGINRNSELVKRKFIEPMTLTDSISFGREVFVFENDHHFKRRIYRYAIDADMSVFFETDDRIVMDHLSPEKPIYEGKFEYYIPDLSFDALELKKGRWIYRPDYDARQHRTLKDRYYNMELPEQQKLY